MSVFQASGSTIHHIIRHLLFVHVGILSQRDPSINHSIDLLIPCADTNSGIYRRATIGLLIYGSYASLSIYRGLREMQLLAAN